MSKQKGCGNYLPQPFLYYNVFKFESVTAPLEFKYTDNFCTNLCLHANHIFYKMRQFFLSEHFQIYDSGNDAHLYVT